MVKKRFLENNSRKINKGIVEVDFGLDRINIIKFFLIACFFIIVGKLFFVQVVKYDEYKAKASSYQDVVEKIPAKRGEIYLIDNKEKSLDNVITDNEISLSGLDKIVSNIYKYNVIVDPKNISDFENKTNDLITILNNKDIDKTIIQNKLVEVNNIEIFTEKFLELAFPDLYKYSEDEKKKDLLESQKKDIEYKINTTKNSRTKALNERKLLDLINSIKFDEETELGIKNLKEERIKILSKLGKINDHYEIINKNIDEQSKDKVKDFFSNLYLEKFKDYIVSENKETREAQLKNFYKNFINFESIETRFYADGNILGQITGFLSTKNDEKIGQYGIEGYYDKDLKGVNGEISGKYDTSGKLIVTSDREVKEAKNGSDIILTIDKSIQYTACKELEDGIERYGAEDGSISIMDPDTGEVLAMCNYPMFDPNDYGNVDDIRVYENPIITDQLEFGSIFKAITMSAGIDSNAVTPYSTYEDTGCIRKADWPKTICDSDIKTMPQGHGTTTVLEALDKSLNLGSFFVASKVGGEKYTEYINNFGFGKETGIENVSEAKGDIRNLSKINYKGGDVYLATASFGQGITVSQIQFMSAFSAIVNGGKLMKPHMVRATIKDGKLMRVEPELIRQVITEESSTTMRGMLASVTEKGYSKLAQVKGYYIGGKTGTAQFAENGVYKEKTMQSFIGFGPVSDPKFVIMIKLNNPKTEYASTSCTPMFSNIAKFLFDYYQIPPEKK